jgi:hypothetical protein
MCVPVRRIVEGLLMSTLLTGPTTVNEAYVEGEFYKRGCQVKTLYPLQGGFVFLGIPFL